MLCTTLVRGKLSFLKDSNIMKDYAYVMSSYYFLQLINNQILFCIGNEVFRSFGVTLINQK